MPRPGRLNALTLLTVALFLAAAGLTRAADAEAAPESEPVAKDFITPTLSVPYASQKPTIDGVVDDAEWQQALSFNALRAMRNGISSRQTRYWLSWDENHLYLAMRSWLREGERPIQRYRGEGGDPYVVMDDSYEFYFDTGGVLAGNLPAYLQYIGNFAGEKYDAAHLPTVGTRRMSYEAGWEPKNRIAQTPNGRAWEMEVVIPRESILAPEEWQDGSEVRALLARNYKRPFEQNSTESAKNFRNTATYTKLVLRRDIPAIHLLGVGDTRGGSIGLSLAAFSTDADRLAWRWASDSGLVREGSLDIAAGQLAVAIDDPALESVKDVDTTAAGDYRLQIRDPDGGLLLDWASTRGIARPELLDQTFDDDKGEQVSLRLVLNPVKDYLRITGDFINFDAHGTIAKTTVTVTDAAGKVLAQKDLAIDENAFVRDVAWLPDLQPGKYMARIVCLNATGETMVESEQAFEKKDHAKEFPWWNNDIGSIERVIEPWTPVQASADSVAVWERQMTIGAAGLPSQITVKGEPILAGPMRLDATTAAGTVSAAAPAISRESTADHRVVNQAVSALGELQISSRVSTEFDGMYKVEMTITPSKATTLTGLQMVVPMAPRFATYLTACGEGIRWGYDHRELPTDTTGEIWNCRKVDGQRMAVGSFIPYVWIGGDRRGLSWFADTDAGWLPNDAVPAIQARRAEAGGPVELVFNLVSSELTIDQPRTITFAFQATPVKALAPDWRYRIYDFGDSFSEWQQAQKIGSNRMQSPVPWTYDPDKTQQMMARYRAAGRMISTQPAPVIPYGRHNEALQHRIPEARYFAEHWNSKNSWHIYYDDSLNDFWMYKLDEWIRTNGIDGYYSDNVHPAVCYNVEAGRGYYLPDGRIQPAYNMFGVREYFLRMRATFQDHGKTGWIVNHMTHNMVAPWMGAVDIALDGEDHTITAEQNRTYLDAWPLERLRADIPHTLGMAITYKTEYDNARHWKTDFRYSFGQVWRSYVAAMQLHDNLPMTGYQMPIDWFLARERVGFNVHGQRFIGYWETGQGITVDHADAKVSAWVLPGRVLLLPVGFQRNDNPIEATITLDPAALGLPPVKSWRVMDAQAVLRVSSFGPDGKPVDLYPATDRKPLFRLQEDGSLLVNLPRHDYRYIVIEAAE